MKKKIGITLAGGLLALVCAGCNKSAKFERYDDAASYVAGNFTYTAGDITKIEIDWVDGAIEIEQSSAPTLTVAEERQATNEKERLHYYFDGTVLKIKYCQSGLKGKISPADKNLRVEIPQGIDLDIDNVGANIVIGVISVNELSLETKTGAVAAEKWNCKSVEVETFGADVSVGEIVASSLDAESTSGKLKFGFSTALSGEIESRNGDVTLSLLKDLGASVRFQTKSGVFTTEKQYTKNENCYDILGADGVSTDCNFAVETGSGNLTVK